MNITQSMSKAGYPYDNAPMERYFNTLKNECTNLYEYDEEEVLYQADEEFAYVEFALTATMAMQRLMKRESTHNCPDLF